MSYDDNRLGPLFPTRVGGITGSSNERQMLDKTGADGIRKSYRTLADGSVVRCETRNGFPKFILERKDKEVLVDIGMDSGVVDLVKASFVWSGAQDENTVDGKLYHTTFVTNYLISAAINDDSPVINIITPPHTGGTPEEDGSVARSFRKKTPTDYTALYQRKRAALLCPPSIFTGKTRLYVQALYGRHDALTNVSASLATTEGLARPSILVSGVEIHTSCGVFLDPATGNHYLLSVEGPTTRVYKMAATTAAEKLRPKLINAGISDSEREKIEAFVLAYSEPKTIVATLSNGVSYTESMGYGWHFNWTGTTCDIVINNVVAAASGGSENESTHYRLMFAFSNGVFSVSAAVIEGPTRWKSYRHIHPITFPSWSTGGLEKFGAHTGPSPYGNAPFYAFYNRDELKVCRYQATTAFVEKKIDSRTPSYYNPGSYYRFGGDAVHYRTHSAWSGTAVSISCGDTEVSYVSGMYSAYDFYSPASTYESGTPTFSAGGYWNIALECLTGYPNHIDTQEIGTEFGPISAYVGNGGTNGATYATVVLGPYSGLKQSVTWTMESPITEIEVTESVQETTAFISVIPFLDAEANILLGAKTTYRTQNGTQRSGHGSFWGIFATYEDQSIRSYYSRAATISNFDITFTSITDVAVPPSTQTTTVMVCNAGVINGVAIPTPGAFFSTTDEIVPVFIHLRTSASGEASYSAESNVSVGVAPADVVNRPFTFAGWA